MNNYNIDEDEFYINIVKNDLNKILNITINSIIKNKKYFNFMIKNTIFYFSLYNINNEELIDINNNIENYKMNINYTTKINNFFKWKNVVEYLIFDGIKYQILDKQIKMNISYIQTHFWNYEYLFLYYNKSPEDVFKYKNFILINKKLLLIIDNDK